MKLIQIFVFAAALATTSAAQTSGQTGDAATSSTTKSQQQHASSAATDAKKKDSAKSNAASKKASSGAASQSGGIKVIPITNGSQSTSPGSKNSAKTAAPAGSKTPAAGKVSTPAAGGKASTPAPSDTAAKKTTGTTTGKTQSTGKALSTTTAQGSKTTASGKQGSKVSGPGKQSAPVVGVSPSSKTTNAKSASTTKAAVSKIPQPKIVPKKPSKADLVVAAKASARVSSAGRRDPFVSPIRAVTPTVPIGPNCSTGKRCLAINELIVQGTAKDTDGRMMAIVASSTHRSYFLRENDQVFNGTVQKITADSVVFRESYVDNLGKQNTHEIVKRINPS